MSNQTRNKDGVGTPSSDNPGSYAESVSNPPADSTLSAEDQKHNAEGTFYYPPAARNAAQVIEFWENVEVSDEILGRFERTYQRRVVTAAEPVRLERKKALVRAKMAAWDAEQEVERASEEYQRLWKKATREMQLRQETKELADRSHNWDEFDAQAEAEIGPYPSDDDIAQVSKNFVVLSRPNVRPLVRAAAMHMYTPKSPARFAPDERQKVLDHTIELAYGETKTVAEIVRDYRLDELNGNYLSPPLRD